VRSSTFKSLQVLKELRDTRVTLGGRSVRPLDEATAITSVSGGSFTAAYYGLYGNRIFTDHEAAFLGRNVERSLIDLAMNPLHWFWSTGRTQWAVERYEVTKVCGGTDWSRTGTIASCFRTVQSGPPLVSGGSGDVRGRRGGGLLVR
jgi:hypothetical protein